jgi:hypothetical protein
MPGCDSGAALVRADQIRSAVKPIDTSAKARRTTLSMGLAVADGSKQVDVHPYRIQPISGCTRPRKMAAIASSRSMKWKPLQWQSPQR